MRLSPSALEQLLRCPMQWFLERQVGAGTPPGAAATIGSVVHAVAEAIANGEVERDMAAIGPFVDQIWASMPFPAKYQSRHERERLDGMLVALLRWIDQNDREVVGAETAFELEMPGDDGGRVLVRGTIDRVERDAEGRVHLVDFKTGKSVASKAATAEHAQLGVYQLAVREGSLGAEAGEATLGGAELVHVAEIYKSDGLPKVRRQEPLDEGRTWVHDLVTEAAGLAAGPTYPARRNGRCSQCSFRHWCPALTGVPASTTDRAGGAS